MGYIASSNLLVSCRNKPGDCRQSLGRGRMKSWSTSSG
jgi:hypothetical protein